MHYRVLKLNLFGEETILLIVGATNEHIWQSTHIRAESLGRHQRYPNPLGTRSGSQYQNQLALRGWFLLQGSAIKTNR